jgi:hypothetical protein
VEGGFQKWKGHCRVRLPTLPKNHDICNPLQERHIRTIGKQSPAKKIMCLAIDVQR